MSKLDPQVLEGVKEALLYACWIMENPNVTEETLESPISLEEIDSAVPVFSEFDNAIAYVAAAVEQLEQGDLLSSAEYEEVVAPYLDELWDPDNHIRSVEMSTEKRMAIVFLSAAFVLAQAGNSPSSDQNRISEALRNVISL